MGAGSFHLFGSFSSRLTIHGSIGWCVHITTAKAPRRLEPPVAIPLIPKDYLGPASTHLRLTKPYKSHQIHRLVGLFTTFYGFLWFPMVSHGWSMVSYDWSMLLWIQRPTEHATWSWSMSPDANFRGSRYVTKPAGWMLWFYSGGVFYMI